MKKKAARTPVMDIDAVTPLLGGLSPRLFMRRHWQKKPLLIRQALPQVCSPVTRSELFALAAQEGVESRLVTQSAKGWMLRHGPLARRALPPLARAGWTLLVQGLEQHVPQARALLDRFRFVPEARLDDLMISYASDGGGVGPHFDSYDVFLLQVQGRRRWRIGRLGDPQLLPDVPLKILSNFEAEEEWLLEPGDMLYLPPRWAHDGVAEGECMTCSIGFRAPSRQELAREFLIRLAESLSEEEPLLYRDPAQLATVEPGLLPAELASFAQQALDLALRGRGGLLHTALGEYLSEPKRNVWFELGHPLSAGVGVTLDARTRMMFDDAHVYVNGESWRAGGRDARLIRQLANARRLPAREVMRASQAARELLSEWAEDGWLHPLMEVEDGRDPSR
ncbi:MAG TPA: cupin domain-containing protein [Methylibium sp.]